MDLSISHDTEDINWNEVCQIIRRGELGDRDPVLAKQVFTGSYACAFAWWQDQLVGVARAISDGVTSSAIYDVVVDPDFQGQGIGRGLMEALLARLPKSSVMLVSVSGKEPFYRKLGFRRLRTAYMLKEDFRSWELGGYFLDDPVPR